MRSAVHVAALGVVAVGAAVVLSCTADVTPTGSGGVTVAAAPAALRSAKLREVEEAIQRRAAERMHRRSPLAHPTPSLASRPATVQPPSACTYAPFTPTPTAYDTGADAIFLSVTDDGQTYSPLLGEPQAPDGAADGDFSDFWVTRTNETLQDLPYFCLSGTCISKTDDMSELLAIMPQFLSVPDDAELSQAVTSVLANASVDIDTVLVPDEQTGQLRPVTKFTTYDMAQVWSQYRRPHFDERMTPWVDVLAGAWSSEAGDAGETLGQGLEAALAAAGVPFGGSPLERAHTYVDWVHTWSQQFASINVVSLGLNYYDAAELGADGNARLLDLADMRRPAWYAGEPIAAWDAKTYSVEFTVPASVLAETQRLDMVARQIAFQVAPNLYPELGYGVNGESTSTTGQPCLFTAVAPVAQGGLGLGFPDAVLTCMAEQSPASDIDVFIDGCVCASRTPAGDCVGLPYVNENGQPRNRSYQACADKAAYLYPSEKESILHLIAAANQTWIERCSSTEMPGCSSGYRYVPPVDVERLRGWYIKGRGVDPCVGDGASLPRAPGVSCGLQHPLVVYHQGSYVSFLNDGPAQPGYPYFMRLAGFRDEAAALASKGYDVLLFDTMQSGNSEGYDWQQDLVAAGDHATYETGLRPDPLYGSLFDALPTGQTVHEPFDTGNYVYLFYALAELTDGTARVYAPPGVSTPQTGVRLLAPGAPIIVGGLSHGAFQAHQEMVLWVGYNPQGQSAPPSVIPPLDYSRFNLRGLFESGGKLSEKYSSYTWSRIAYGVITAGGDYELKGSGADTVPASDPSLIRRFPAWMGSKGIHEQQTGVLDSDVDTYNLIEGPKRIHTIFGHHFYDWMLPNFAGTVHDIEGFIDEALWRAVPFDQTHAQTTFAAQMCATPFLDPADPLYFVGWADPGAW